MLTTEDIQNSARKSGFDYVGPNEKGGPTRNGRRPSWRASRGSRKTGTSGLEYGWRGPSRATPEEAAQDYCDYVNGPDDFMVIDDLRNDKCKSGFDHVRVGHPGSIRPYQAQAYGARTKHRNGFQFRGPYRATAEEAAQDYCDYVNGSAVIHAPAFESPIEIDMGGAVKHSPAAEKIKIDREVFTGPHDYYDVLLYDPHTKQVFRRKVGITANGDSRYAGVCKTFGFSLKALAPAETFPTKPAAEAEETKRIAEIAQNDPKWQQVGKEAFAPVGQMFLEESDNE